MKPIVVQHIYYWPSYAAAVAYLASVNLTLAAPKADGLRIVRSKHGCAIYSHRGGPALGPRHVKVEVAS